MATYILDTAIEFERAYVMTPYVTIKPLRNIIPLRNYTT